jgi:hypothetical protein
MPWANVRNGEAPVNDGRATARIKSIEKMAIEVGISRRSPRRYGALICTALLLIGSMALAQLSVVARAKNLLGERIRLSAWPISFRVPAGFRHVPPASGEAGDLHLLHRDLIRLFVGPVPLDGDQDAADVCHEIWNELASELPADYSPPSLYRRSTELMGTGGFEIVDVYRGLAIRAALLDAEHAVVVILVSQRGPLQGYFLRLFSALCDSVQRSE